MRAIHRFVGENHRMADVRHLRLFLQEYADRAPAGLVLYGGDEVYWVDDGVLAVPIRHVLGPE